MPVTEGTTALPNDNSAPAKYQWGMYDGTNFYLPRIDNTTAKNLRVALYDSLGNPLLIADDAAFTPATSRVLPVGFFADESATDSVDEGDMGAPRMTLNRIVRVVPSLHDGTTEGADSQRGNVGLTALASAARVATTSAASLTNHNAKGIAVFLNITVTPGNGETLTFGLIGIDPASGNNPFMFQGAAYVASSGAATLFYIIYPGVGAAAQGITGTASFPLPRTFSLKVTHSAASSWTYSVGYVLLL